MSKRILSELGRVPKITWLMLVLVIIFSIGSSTFLTINNLLNVGRQASVLIIIAMGTTLVILSGGVDLSSGTLMSLTGVIAVMALNELGVPLVVGFLLGILVGVLAGTINGLLITRGRMPPFIATFGMLAMAQGLALVITEGASQTAPKGFYRFIGNGDVLGIPALVFLALAVFLVCHFILHQTHFGTYIVGIGSNEDAVGKTGVNVDRWKVVLYAFAGGLAGLGGIALSSRMSTAHPIVGLGWEFDAVAAVVLGGTSLQGGRGGLAGTLIGVLLIAILRNGLNQIGLPSNWQYGVTGVVIVMALVVEVVLSDRQLQWSARGQ
jgi:ribose/xylose/arabinose/galactoside ABC-type transport system permease subunit